MYKDKDKQREAAAGRQRRYKDRQKALLSEGVTGKALPTCIGCVPETKDTGPARRGKDITCFTHLPPDVQATINRLSTNQDGTVDEQARANRTAIAIDYQHNQPDRYYSTGI